MSNIPEFSEEAKIALAAELKRDYVIKTDNQRQMALLYPRKLNVGKKFGTAERIKLYADMNDRMQKLSKRGLEHVRTAVRDSLQPNNQRLVIAMLSFPIDLAHIRNRAIMDKINDANASLDAEVVDMTALRIR